MNLAFYLKLLLMLSSRLLHVCVGARLTEGRGQRTGDRTENKKLDREHVRKRTGDGQRTEDRTANRV